MLKQAFLSGLLAATTVVSFGSVVRADSPNNQISGQEAAVVGAFNTIRQSSNQFNLVNVQQPNSGLPGSSSAVNPDSLQSAKQAASAVVWKSNSTADAAGNLQRQILSPP